MMDNTTKALMGITLSNLLLDLRQEGGWFYVIIAALWLVYGVSHLVEAVKDHNR